MLEKKEINEILEGEKLSLYGIIRISDRFALISALPNNGKDTAKKKVVLKILADPAKKFAKISLKKESSLLEFLIYAKRDNLNAPKFLGSNFDCHYPYFKEEFIDGDILEGKSGFFFKNLEDNDISKLAGIAIALRNIDISVMLEKIPNLSDFSSKYFDLAVKFHKEQIKEFLNKEQKLKLSVLLNRANELIKAGNNTSAVHGEVYPNNLVKDKKGDIFLIDWENIGIGSPARDSASIYLRIKDSRQSQLFMEKLPMMENVNFKLFFQLEIILQSIGGIDHFQDKKIIINQKERESSIKYFSQKIEEAFNG
jgi:hypothetical protein